ncbi:MAG: 4-(cytidine 5'-diphospho)-2-C-methyl-D-erythritol kinase [Clostridia bacterium]|nr:4-(cytidine 5'-diphospho)-2-C-methyl-D-erythritol kinase [Clostridia bacterium]
METITLSAYAKINLTLGITGIREDGYHTLETLMQEISLADTVILQKIPQGILIDCDRSGIPTDEKNICYKAAKGYFEKSGIKGGIRISLQKRIPDGAGMGGGSADAAAVLKGMSALYPAKVPLAEIALHCGADVPFFLEGGTAFCQGIGEMLTPLSFRGKEKVFCVVAKNCDGLSTPKIYSLYDSLPQNKKARASLDVIRTILSKGDHAALFALMENDLELPAVTLRPQIIELKEALLKNGADCAMMTGSGSAVFGLFLSEEKARAAEAALKPCCRDAHFCTLL